MSYWIYESQSTKRGVVIHRSACAFCPESDEKFGSRAKKKLPKTKSKTLTVPREVERDFEEWLDEYERSLRQGLHRHFGIKTGWQGPFYRLSSATKAAASLGRPVGRCRRCKP
jgi:hypothetical protein